MKNINALQETMKTISYTATMGEYDYPAELREKTAGLPIGEQLRYLCVKVHDIYNGNPREYYNSLCDALHFGGVIVHDDLVVGIFRTGGYTDISLLGHEQMVYFAVETDGAGEDTLDSYETVTYSLEPVWEPYYPLYYVPEGVTVLQKGVLPRADGYVIGPTVRHIDKEAFANSNANLYYQGDIEGWLSITGKENLCMGVYLLDEQEKVRNGITIPNGITVVPPHAFHCCCGINYVDLPDTVVEIGEKAFACPLAHFDYYGTFDKWLSLKGKENLRHDVHLYFGGSKSKPVTSVTIPEGTTEVPDFAFCDCVNLTQINLPDGITTIGAYAFAHTSITSIHLSDALTAIGAYAFSNTNISDIHLPNGLTEIPDGAFFACHSLAAIDLPQSVQSIGEHAFDSAELTAISIPAAVHTIGARAFQNSKLKELHLFALPAKFGKDILAYTPNELKVYFHGTLTQWLVPSELRVCDVVFSEGVIVNGVLRIPEGITDIPEDAFAYMRGVNSVILPASVRTIGKHAFSWMNDLKSVDLASTTKIGEAAFASCPALVEVKPSACLETIENFAFYNCKALRTIYLPASVRKVGAGVFSDNARKLVVRCAAPSCPEGWDSHWNIKDYSLNTYVTVEWGVTEE